METKPTRPIAPQPAAGISRDLARLRTDGRATVAELREFVHSLRGRPPGEVLGLVSESGLFRATATATVGTIVLMALFTAGPYAWNKAFPPPVSAAAKAKAEAEESAVAKKTSSEAAPEEKASGNAESDRGSEALKKMGESDTRISDPTKNPLENSADDLLKDIK